MNTVKVRETAQAKHVNRDGHSIQGGLVTSSKPVSYGVDCKDDWRKRFNTKAKDRNGKPVCTPYKGTGNTTGDTYNVC